MQRTFTRTITVEFTLTTVQEPGANVYDDLDITPVDVVIKNEKNGFLWEWFKNTEYDLIDDEITEMQPASAS